MHHKTQPISILVCALGGEGGGVLSEWLVQAALLAGYPVQGTSIPGVAQRTGATTYYVEIFPVPQSELAGRRPVFSLYPVPGALDLLVSSELLETVRQIGNGYATAQRTRVISSSTRTLTTHERMQLGDGRMPDTPLREVVARHSREHQVFDMAAVTREAGTVVSAVMFGAVAASGLLPFPRTVCEQVIRAGERGVDASLRGFASAFDIVSSARQRTTFVRQVVADDPSPAVVPTRAPAAAALPREAAAAFPAATHDLLTLGLARMVDYQDQAYGELYLERLQRILAAERASDPDGDKGWAITRETARYLALWMAFDDIVRVADLKCRASRRDRVRQEVKVADGELLRIYDHFKPGAAELAALLPEGPAQALLRWDRRRQARGKEPFSLALKVGTHQVLGFLSLRVLASLPWLRRRGSRFALEQNLIERWLAAVEHGARTDWTLGHEIALCGRLIKGYGSTNERGKDNLLHVIDHLALSQTVETAARRADAIRAARSAALADEAGTALDLALQQHGAPARPVKEVPIRFMRRPARSAAQTP
ncbi:indolepyruvate oxidoreductase subunit beta family protein [Comamonadaceae bacterium G21597-S1]|nr:indolepyruvate oxidoreductase subunit beta family protein [Comamonadaceae bacterium G21597-S1]